MAILVTGGLGYIGSAIVRRLVETEQPVVVLDDLSTGHLRAIPDTVPRYIAPVSANIEINRMFQTHKIDACIHTAGMTSVAESKIKPCTYFDSNVSQSMALFESLVEHGVKKVVFSSSAAARHPEMSPYGASKHIIEEQLKFLYGAHKLQSISLRYFNVIGATSADHGEHHFNETHLVPNALAVAAGESPFLTVYNEGNDIRDYIHISDVVEANIAALAQVKNMAAAKADIGTGTGHTTLSIIREVSRVTKKDIPVVFKEGRKEGKELIAERINWSQYGLTNFTGGFQWEPHESLFNGIKSAWEWKQKFPRGYNK